MPEYDLEIGTLIITEHADQLGIIINILPTNYKGYEVLWFMNCGQSPRRWHRPRRLTKYSKQAFLNNKIYTLKQYCIKQRGILNEREDSKTNS
jgi:hypothetical protein